MQNYHFGMAKTIQPQIPNSRTSSTGRNIPMHQVHEQPRNAAQARGDLKCAI